jgi:hypothetical protein
MTAAILLRIEEGNHECQKFGALGRRGAGHGGGVGLGAC